VTLEEKGRLRGWGGGPVLVWKFKKSSLVSYILTF